MGEIIVYVTTSSEEEALNIAKAIVEEKLAACV
ncbi:MAG: divalent-cation tolerance protein CutA, partial [Nitrospirae bacterium]